MLLLLIILLEGIYTWYILVNQARKIQSPPSTKVRTCCSGKGRFLLKRKTPLKRLSQRAGDNTFLLNCNYFACSQKTWNSCSSLPVQGCIFHTENITMEFESPWDLRQGFFSFDKTRQIGIRPKTWILKVVLFQFIRNNRVWVFGIDHGKCFISFIHSTRRLFWNCSYKRISRDTHHFVQNGWFWPILAGFRYFSPDAFWRNNLNLVLKYLFHSRAQHRFLMSLRSHRTWL